MRLRALEVRLLRLETRRGTGKFDGLPYERLERLLFDRLHRLAAAAGGIDELVNHWDMTNDPRERELIARIRTARPDTKAHYRDLEARLCPQH